MNMLLSCIILFQCMLWTQSGPIIPPIAPTTPSAIDLAMSHFFQDMHSHTHNAINPFSSAQSAQFIHDLIQSETFGGHIRHLFQSCVSRYRGTVARAGASEAAINSEAEHTATEIADAWTDFANSLIESLFSSSPENRESVLGRQSADASSRHRKRGAFDQLEHVERQSIRSKPAPGSAKRRMAAMEDHGSEHSSQDVFYGKFQADRAESMDEVSSYYFPSENSHTVSPKPMDVFDELSRMGVPERPKHLSDLPITDVPSSLKRSKASWNLVGMERDAILKEELKSFLVQPIAHALKEKSKPLLAWLLHQI